MRSNFENQSDFINLSPIVDVGLAQLRRFEGDSSFFLLT